MTWLQPAAPSPGTDAANQEAGEAEVKVETENCFQWQEHVGCSYYNEHLKSYNKKQPNGCQLVAQSTIKAH